LGVSELTYARSNRRTNLIGEKAKQVVTLAKEKGYALAVEDLKFKNDKSVTAKFNRMATGLPGLGFWHTLTGVLPVRVCR